MPFYRSTRRRRFFNRRRIRYSKSKKALRKIKRDILKNNFPTKIKFMGLPEKKVMFLQNESTLNFIGGNNDNTKRRFIQLTPLTCPNTKTLYSTVAGINGTNYKIWNWDKISILAIYVRLQPCRNNFVGGLNDSITPIKCYYAINNIISEGDANQKFYDHNLLDSKNIFTFNSNESFTIVLRAPSTMSEDNPHIHKAYSWWSIADIDNSTDTPLIKLEDETEENDENTEEYNNYGNPMAEDKVRLHCGYLYFESSNTCSYNISISYKVALKG